MPPGSKSRPARFMVALFWFCSLAFANMAFGTVDPGQEPEPDAQHDFDFDLGTWKRHSNKLLHPLSGFSTWVGMDGLTVVRKVWDGRANLAEYKADGKETHVELLSLRIYNPAAQQWSLAVAAPDRGALSVPAI